MKSNNFHSLVCSFCGSDFKSQRFNTKYCSSRCRVYAGRRRKVILKRHLEAKPIITNIIRSLSCLDNLLPGSLSKGQKLFVKECRFSVLKLIQYDIDNS